MVTPELFPRNIPGSNVQYKRPTRLQTIGILANPFTYGFAAMVLTVWAGGKICDLVDRTTSRLTGDRA